MARVLDKFDFPTFGGGAKESHPWATWADGKIRQLKHGDDFNCKLQTICQQARNYGKKNGLKVRINAPKGGDVVTLQFLKAEELERRRREEAAAAVTGETSGKAKKK